MATEGESNIPADELAPGPKYPELKLEGREWMLPSDTAVLNLVWTEVERRLSQAGWNEEESNRMLVGLNEALTNAIEHGNLEVPSESTFESYGRYREAVAAAARTNLAQRHVRVTVDITPDRINFSVGDQGKGFDIEKLKDPRSDDQILREGGRGVFLTKQGFDIVGYNKTGNQVWMEKRRVVAAS